MKTPPAFRFLLPALTLVLLALFALATKLPAGQLGGQLRDGATHEPIPQANVVLLRAADGAYVATATTHADGSFEFRNLPLGQYRLETTVLGYEAPRAAISLSARQPRLPLGAVELAPLTGKAVATVPPVFSADAHTKIGNAGRYALSLARR